MFLQTQSLIFSRTVFLYATRTGSGLIYESVDPLLANSSAFSFLPLLNFWVTIMKLLYGGLLGCSVLEYIHKLVLCFRI